MATLLALAAVLGTTLGAGAWALTSFDLASAWRTAFAPPPSGATPSPTPAISLLPGQIAMPTGVDCAACHVTVGGQVGVKPIPALAHPLHGWTLCTECHANDRLVKTAPGHTGFHASDCLVCHREASKPAPPPKHASQPASDCLACHGTIAPLPSSMTNRPANLCWLCHQGSSS
jgi:hypothetical protein